MEEKKQIIGMQREEMEEEMIEEGVKESKVKMRIRKIWNWIYVRGV